MHAGARDHQDQEKRAKRQQSGQQRPRTTERQRSPVSGRPRARQVVNDRVQLAVRPGRERRVETLLKLVGKQPPLTCGMAEAFGRLFAVAIGRAQWSLVGHRHGVRDLW